ALRGLFFFFSSRRRHTIFSRDWSSECALPIYYMRLDLRADKRYTLSGTTLSLLAQLDRPLVVTVFLDGDLSTDINRLQVAAKDLLDEYRARSGGKLEVTFVDPLAEVSGEAARSEERRVGKECR